MSWLVVPRHSASILLYSTVVRTWIARRLPDDVEEAFALETAACKGRITRVSEQVSVLGLWEHDDSTSIRLDETPLLSIWSDANQSSVWSVGDEERSELLERLCQLAERCWSLLALPSHWEPKKVDKFPSVFAGDRQLKNIRVAYLVRHQGDRIIVDVGSVYYARRNQKEIVVPQMPSDSVAGLPVSIQPPTVWPGGETPDESDVLITPPPEGEARHLFALKYSDWMDRSGPLTRQQRRVIAHKVQRPLRVHGPAGSGKTLVLILKALKILRDAQGSNERCHVLMVLHSAAMKETVRAAIEAIDDVGFLATTKRDKQFLDVETLHGWCIRELGLEHGPRYVLDEDPIVSRDLQRQILEDAVEEALAEKYPSVKEYLSSDFIARAEGDRREFVRSLGWEIAIRIKGRGFKPGDQEAYVKNRVKSFVGKNEVDFDRYLIFHMYRIYEEKFSAQGLLDTDDVVLSMSARLTTSLWDRQRRDLGYDYVCVDEAHLFNQNERNVVPYLTRRISPGLPIVMTFDEAQSIGGRRSEGDDLGLPGSEKRTLTAIHRSAPAVFALARDLVERGPLAFSEFVTAESSVRMSERELKRSGTPSIVLAEGEGGVLREAVRLCSDLRSRNYQRVGVIVFGFDLLEELFAVLRGQDIPYYFVRERGEIGAAMPRPGVYVMTPEACGGLEFDAVVMVGVESGRVPIPVGNLSVEGTMVLEHDAYIQLYTAITRAKYRVVFVCDRYRGPSPILRESIEAGLLEVVG